MLVGSDECCDKSVTHPGVIGRRLAVEGADPETLRRTALDLLEPASAEPPLIIGTPAKRPLGRRWTEGQDCPPMTGSPMPHTEPKPGT